LEHIYHPDLIAKLDAFLGYPSFDPHGDPIPNEEGIMPSRETLPLSQVNPVQEVILAGLHEHTPDFLRFLDRLELKIGTRMKVMELIAFDESIVLQIGKREVILNKSITKNLLVLKNG
jgi:DtxR family Mn-dependent transcriptional regulator